MRANDPVPRDMRKPLDIERPVPGVRSPKPDWIDRKETALVSFPRRLPWDEEVSFPKESALILDLG